MTWNIPEAAWQPIPGHAGAVSAEGMIYGAGRMMAGYRSAPVRVRIAQHPTTGKWICQAQAIGDSTVKPAHGIHETAGEAKADAPRVLGELIAKIEEATAPLNRPAAVEKPPSKAEQITWSGAEVSR
jgi:hypothetical protein